MTATATAAPRIATADSFARRIVPVATRQRLEDRRVARVDRERVPLRGGHERGDDHRQRQIEELVVERQDGRLSRRQHQP